MRAVLCSCLLVALTGCGLVVSASPRADSAGSAIGVAPGQAGAINVGVQNPQVTVPPATVPPATAAPTTTTTIAPFLEMEINDDYQVGEPLQAACDAAWFMLLRGADLAALTEEDSMDSYLFAITATQEATAAMAAAAGFPLRGEGESAVAFFESLLTLGRSGATVAEVRDASLRWETPDGTSRWTLLTAVEAACPQLLQNVVVTPEFFGGET